MYNSILKSLFKLIIDVIIIVILTLTGLSYPMFSTASGQHPHLNHVKLVNQPENSLTSYINYHHFHFVNNRNYAEPNNYSTAYNQIDNPNRQFKYVGGNQKMDFTPYAQLKNVDSLHNPQSVAITNNGTVYVTHRTDNLGEIQIIRYQIKQVNHHLQFTHYTVGPIFHGGHGQGLAYNPRNHQLWLLTNEQGSANQTSVQEISKTNLNPLKQINFYMYPYPMGDVLAFDKRGNAYTCTRTFNARGNANQGSLKLYKGKIGPNRVKFHMVQGIRHAPGLIMQNMSYNPVSDRIYFVTDGELMSVPAKHFSHLRPNDVRATKLSGRYEFEGLAFYRNRGYLLVHYPSELLISKK